MNMVTAQKGVDLTFKLYLNNHITLTFHIHQLRYEVYVLYSWKDSNTDRKRNKKTITNQPTPQNFQHRGVTSNYTVFITVLKLIMYHLYDLINLLIRQTVWY